MGLAPTPITDEERAVARTMAKMRAGILGEPLAFIGQARRFLLVLGAQGYALEPLCGACPEPLHEHREGGCRICGCPEFEVRQVSETP